MDEINPATNKTYCEGLTNNGMNPNQIQAMGGTTWGPGYQRQVVMNMVWDCVNSVARNMKQRST